MSFIRAPKHPPTNVPVCLVSHTFADDPVEGGGGGEVGRLREEPMACIPKP